LINALVGEKLAIVTPRAQTTRHRIRGILSEPGCQLVISDTPGHLEPAYALQQAMMQTLDDSLEDADALVYVAGPRDEPEDLPELLKAGRARRPPWVLALNKIDTANDATVKASLQKWTALVPPERQAPLSVAHGFNLERLKQILVSLMPEHPPFFSDEWFTDRSERFLAAEIVREQVFLQYRQEVPYSTEVVVRHFREEGPQLYIEAELMVERPSQKGILIGRQGEGLKRLGHAARQQLRAFFGRAVYLQLYVKARPKWRNDKGWLKRLGYMDR
jgi:GTP-binding protein Era